MVLTKGLLINGGKTMPLKLYERERILDACFEVFARHGYANTTASMLAKAAGISKGLIFYHFKSKKELYLSIVDRCIEKGKMEMGIDEILENEDFFSAKEKISVAKFHYYKERPRLLKIMRETFYETPDELKKELEKKYGELQARNEKMWRRLFEKVPLKEGVDRDQAFRLITLVLEHFENKYLADLEKNQTLDEAYLRDFLEERNRFLSMIRFGIEKKGGDIEDGKNGHAL